MWSKSLKLLLKVKSQTFKELKPIPEDKKRQNYTLKITIGQIQASKDNLWMDDKYLTISVHKYSLRWWWKNLLSKYINETNSVIEKTT